MSTITISDEMKARIIYVDMKLSDLITDNTLKFGKEFPFKDHAWDYVIESIAESKGSYLITDNSIRETEHHEM